MLLLFKESERGLFSKINNRGKIVKPATNSGITKPGYALVDKLDEKERTIFASGNSLVFDPLPVIDEKFIIETFKFHSQGHIVNKILLADGITEAIRFTGKSEVIGFVNNEMLTLDYTDESTQYKVIGDITDQYEIIYDSIVPYLNNYYYQSVDIDDFKFTLSKLAPSIIHSDYSILIPCNIYGGLHYSIGKWMFPVCIDSNKVNILALTNLSEILKEIKIHNTMILNTWKKYGFDICNKNMRIFSDILNRLKILSGIQELKEK